MVEIRGSGFLGRQYQWPFVSGCVCVCRISVNVGQSFAQTRLVVGQNFPVILNASPAFDLY